MVQRANPPPDQVRKLTKVDASENFQMLLQELLAFQNKNDILQANDTSSNRY
jgi:hypothetical protein